MEAAAATLPFESICSGAKHQKCPHGYPQITSPGFSAEYRQILSLFRRSSRARDDSHAVLDDARIPVAKGRFRVPLDGRTHCLLLGAQNAGRR